MKFLLSFFLAATLAAQTATYPAAVAAPPDLKIAANNLVTKLVLSADIGDGAISVANASLIQPNMLLTVDVEIMSVVSVNGNAVTVLRGFDGTAVASHAKGKTVSANIDAYHHNKLSAEIQSIENALGPNLSNLPRGANRVVPSDYNFAQQYTGVALVANSTNVIPMAPCPVGVAGTDRKHYVAMTGGGAADSIELIAGGTCTSGAPTGTLIITASVARTSLARIGPASSGIQEAANSLGATGGEVSLPASTFNLLATVAVDHYVSITGAGSSSTKVVPASCSATAFELLSQPEPAPTGYPVYNTASYQIRNLMIDGHGCNGPNTQIGIAANAGTDTVTTSLFIGIRVDGVIFNNVGQGTHLERTRDSTLTNVRGYGNTRFVWTDTAGGFAANNHTFETHIEDFEYRSGCYYSPDCSAASITAPVIQWDTVEVGSIHTAYMEGQGSALLNNIAIQVAGGSENIVIDHVTTSLFGYSLQMQGGPLNGTTFYPGYVYITQCAFDGIVTKAMNFVNGINGLDFQSVHNVQVTSSSFSNMVTFTGAGTDLNYIGNFSRDISFVNDEWSGMQGAQVGVHVASYVNGITITSSIFDVPVGLQPVAANAIGVKIDTGTVDIIIKDNQFFGLQLPIVDNSGPGPLKEISSNAPAYLIPSPVPTWTHSVIKKVANGTFPCATAGGCWQTSEPLIGTVPVATANTQTVYIKAVVGNPAVPLFVERVRIKPSVACTGTTTFTGTLGSPSNPAFFIATPFNLAATPSAAVFYPANGKLDSEGSSFMVDNMGIYMTTTGGTLDQIVTGCQLDVYVLSASLPN